MRTPLLSCLAAALLITAAPALVPAFAHGGDTDDGGINCPVTHAAPVRHHVHVIHHAQRSGGCPTRVAHEEHGRPAWAGEGHGWGPPPARGGDDEYGRQNFSWAPTGPGDEHPGPSTWRPGEAGPGLYGAPPAGYAERDLDHRGFDQRDVDHRDLDHRDQGERAFSDQFSRGERGDGAHDLDHRDQGEREFSDRAGHGGEVYGQGGGDFDHRGSEQRGMGEQRFAYGYSHEEQRSWSSQGGGLLEERRTCHCDGHASATDQYGFLTWPGKTHFWRGPPPSDQPMGPGGPPPWADDQQGSVIVHP